MQVTFFYFTLYFNYNNYYYLLLYIIFQFRRGIKPFRFWLFNDKLLYGEDNGFGLYRLSREILLTQCRVVDANNVENNDRAFQIESPAKSFIVWAP